jgi:uncharacterized protein (TIGR02284 family)
MADNSRDTAVSALNELIETCKDGANGYRTAADDVKDATLKSLFAQFASQREQFATELQQQVRSLGGDPEKSGSTLAAAHRGWINVKSAVTGRDDAAILAECDRGDEYAVKAYETAVGAGLPANVLSIVQRQAAEVKRAHDQVHRLKETRGS